MKFGGWKINPIVGGAMPQKVATEFVEATEKLIGATYDPIAYLGAQLANGTNHAILATQKIASGNQQTNVVIMKFNEKGMDCTLYAIEPVLQGGAAFGGYNVNPVTGKDIPEEAMKAFDQVMSGFVGSHSDPIALLGTKVVKGVNYCFICKTIGVYPNAEPTLKLVIVNPLTNTVDFETLLSGNSTQNISLGAPLGEWP